MPLLYLAEIHLSIYLKKIFSKSFFSSISQQSICFVFSYEKTLVKLDNTGGFPVLSLSEMTICIKQDIGEFYYECLRFYAFS